MKNLQGPLFGEMSRRLDRLIREEVITMKRRFAPILLLMAIVSIGTSGCLLVPVPVGGGHHHYRHW